MTADYFAIYKSLGLTSDSDKAAALKKSVIADEAEQLTEGNANVVVESARVHPVQSSYFAFFVASKEATEQLLGVAPGYEHNIRW